MGRKMSPVLFLLLILVGMVPLWLGYHALRAWSNATYQLAPVWIGSLAISLLGGMVLSLEQTYRQWAAKGAWRFDGLRFCLLTLPCLLVLVFPLIFWIPGLSDTIREGMSVSQVFLFLSRLDVRLTTGVLAGYTLLTNLSRSSLTDSPSEGTSTSVQA